MLAYSISISLELLFANLQASNIYAVYCLYSLCTEAPIWIFLIIIFVFFILLMFCQPWLRYQKETHIIVQLLEKWPFIVQTVSSL